MIIKRKLFAKGYTHSIKNSKVPIDTDIDRNDVAETKLDNSLYRSIGDKAWENFGDDSISANNFISEEIEKEDVHPDAYAVSIEKCTRWYLKNKKENTQ